MIKLIALYKKPADADAIEAFEKHYFENHMPLVAKIPGLIKSEVSNCWLHESKNRKLIKLKN